MFNAQVSVDEADEVVDGHDPHFEPVISLPPVLVKTLEEDEEELVKLRAKLFRYETAEVPHEWKERGTGDVKILKHRENGMCRILMRRDKTLKICANHHVLPDMDLKPKAGCNRAWVWTTSADFADEEPKAELLAIRFASAENAQKFKEVFDSARHLMACRLKKGDFEKSDGDKTISSPSNDAQDNSQSEVISKDKDGISESEVVSKDKDGISELEVVSRDKNSEKAKNKLNSQICDDEITPLETPKNSCTGDSQSKNSSTGDSEVDVEKVSANLGKLVVENVE